MGDKNSLTKAWSPAPGGRPAQGHRGFLFPVRLLRGLFVQGEGALMFLAHFRLVQAAGCIV